MPKMQTTADPARAHRVFVQKLVSEVLAQAGHLRDGVAVALAPAARAELNRDADAFLRAAGIALFERHRTGAAPGLLTPLDAAEDAAEGLFRRRYHHDPYAFLAWREPERGRLQRLADAQGPLAYAAPRGFGQRRHGDLASSVLGREGGFSVEEDPYYSSEEPFVVRGDASGAAYWRGASPAAAAAQAEALASHGSTAPKRNGAPTSPAMAMALYGAAVDAFGDAAVEVAKVAWNHAKAQSTQRTLPAPLSSPVGSVQISARMARGVVTRRVTVASLGGFGGLRLSPEHRTGSASKPRWEPAGPAVDVPFDPEALRGTAAAMLRAGFRRAGDAR